MQIPKSPALLGDSQSLTVLGVAFIKGKSAIAIARNYGGKRENFVGQHFWARGYYVSTVEREEMTVRQYIQRQEVEDQRIEQLRLTDECKCKPL